MTHSELYKAARSLKAVIAVARQEFDLIEKGLDGILEIERLKQRNVILISFIRSTPEGDAA